jgi:hypothetical protein
MGDGVAESREEWLAVRLVVRERRQELAVAAGALYPDVPRVAGTALLGRPEWVAAEPVELDRVRLDWVDQADRPVVTGGGPETALVRPLAGEGERFGTYAEAVGELDRPALFEDRPTYRLLDADFGAAGVGRLELTSGRYFESTSVSEALVHEFAAAVDERGVEGVRLEDLPLRAAVGDPLDLRRRPVSVAISTLTLRRCGLGEASFLLHWRDPEKVTHAGGMHQVMPVGIFQPGDDNPESVRHDLSLWRNMVREFSEELLGESEDHGRFGSPIRYEEWPFYGRLAAARRDGELRTWALGLGVDPLSMVADVLTVAVFEADLFDDVFGGLVSVNAEGQVVGDDAAVGFAFVEHVVQNLADESMQAAGSAVLRLAWSMRRSVVSD